MFSILKRFESYPSGKISGFIDQWGEIWISGSYGSLKIDGVKG